jgi:hypothetical protein
MHPTLQRVLQRASSFGAMPPRQWVPNRDLATVLHSVDLLTNRDGTGDALPGLWHNMKLLTMHSLPRCNAPVALSALHHLGKHRALGLVEARQLQDQVAKGMSSLSYTQLLMVLGAVAQAGAKLTPTLHDAALRKTRALIGAVELRDLWMVGEVLLRHFPDHAGFADALLARLRGVTPTQSSAGGSTSISAAASAAFADDGIPVSGSVGTLAGGSDDGGRHGMPVGDLLFLLHVVCRIRGPSEASAVIANVAVETLFAEPFPQARHLLLALSVASVHGALSASLAAASAQVAQEVGNDVAAGIVESGEVQRCVAAIALSVPLAAWCEAWESVSGGIVTRLVDVRSGTVMSDESFSLAAALCGLLRSRNADDELVSQCCQKVRLRLQRVVGTCQVSSLPEIASRCASAGLLDDAAASYMIDRLRGSGAPFNVVQKTLGHLARAGVGGAQQAPGGRTPVAVQSADARRSRRAIGGHEPTPSLLPVAPAHGADGHGEDEAPASRDVLMAQLALGLQESNLRSVDAALHGIASLRGDEAPSARDAFATIVSCTRAGHKVPAARVPLSTLTFRCTQSPLLAIAASTRLVGHIDNEAVGGIVSRSLAELGRLGGAHGRCKVSDAESSLAHDVAENGALLAPSDTLSIADAFEVLHGAGWTRRVPHPSLLRHLYRTAAMSPTDACDALRLACRFGLDSNDLLQDLVRIGTTPAEASPIGPPVLPAEASADGADMSTGTPPRRLSPAAVDELAFACSTALGAAGAPVLAVLRGVAEAWAADVTATPAGEAQKVLDASGLVCLVSALNLCGAEPSIVADVCGRVPSGAGDVSSWPLRSSLTAFGPLQQASDVKLRVRTSSLWRETVKRLTRLAVTDVPMQDAHAAAECLVVALREQASSSALDSMAAKLALRGVVPHLVAAIAAASLKGHRRPAVVDIVTRSVDGTLCRALSAAALCQLVGFFTNARERASIGVIKCDAALAQVWAALELKLDRVDDAALPPLVASCPEPCVRALADRVRPQIRRVAGPAFAPCVALLTRLDPGGAWVEDAQARFAEIAWEVEPSELEATRRALR